MEEIHLTWGIIGTILAAGGTITTCGIMIGRYKTTIESHTSSIDKLVKTLEGVPDMIKESIEKLDTEVEEELKRLQSVEIARLGNEVVRNNEECLKRHTECKGRMEHSLERIDDKLDTLAEGLHKIKGALGLNGAK